MRRLIPKLTVLRICLFVVGAAAVVGLSVYALPLPVSPGGVLVTIALGILLTLGFWVYYGRARARSTSDRSSEPAPRATDDAPASQER